MPNSNVVVNVSVLGSFSWRHYRPVVMGKLVVIVLSVLDALACLGTAQQHARIGPWRHRIQWENNGQLYSLLTTGTQYRSPAQTRRRTQLLLTTKNSFNRINTPVALTGSSRTRSGEIEGAAGGHSQRNENRQMDASVLGADAAQYLLASERLGSSRQSPPRISSIGGAGPHQGPSNGSAAAFTTIQEFSGSGVPRGGRSTPGDDDAGAQRTAAPPVRPPAFTHSRGGHTRYQTSDSTLRSPFTSGWNIMSEDNGNARRTPQQTSSSARRENSLTRVTPESHVSPTALSSNAVEIHFPRPRPVTTRTADTSDPRDPHSIHHRNSVFYNVYPQDRRNRITAGLPAPGFGTRFFHNG